MWIDCEKISEVICFCEVQCGKNSAHNVTHIVRWLCEECEWRWILLMWVSIWVSMTIIKCYYIAIRVINLWVHILFLIKIPYIVDTKALMHKKIDISAFDDCHWDSYWGIKGIQLLLSLTMWATRVKTCCDINYQSFKSQMSWYKSYTLCYRINTLHVF